MLFGESSAWSKTKNIKKEHTYTKQGSTSPSKKNNASLLAPFCLFAAPVPEAEGGLPDQTTSLQKACVTWWRERP